MTKKRTPKKKTPKRKSMADAMTLMNLTTGKWVSQALSVAAELGIADVLQAGTKTAAEIARDCLNHYDSPPSSRHWSARWA